MTPTESVEALSYKVGYVLVVLGASGYLAYRGMQLHSEGGPGIMDVFESAKEFYEQLTS